MLAEALGQLLEAIASIWQPDAKGSRRRAWTIILVAATISAVLATIAFTDVL